MMIAERTITRATLLLFLVVGPALAGDKQDLDDVVRKQGEEIAKLKEEVQGLRGQDAVRLEKDISAYLETTSDEVEKRDPAYRSGGAFGGRVRLGGYFSLEFRDDGDDKNSVFDLHRVVLKIASEIADAISFETEIEIEGGGADVDFLDDNEIVIEFAELRFELVEDILTLKVGAILMPWGRFNKVHDDPLNDLTDRPLVSRRLAAVAFDQPGIGAEGTVEIAGGWFVDYDVALVNGFDEGITTNGGVRGGRQSFRSDNNNNKQVFSRFVLSVPASFLSVLEVGVSGTYGKYDDRDRQKVYGYGVDLFVKKGPFELTFEYMNLAFQRDPSAPNTDPRRMDGWYVQIAYHFFPSSWRGKHALFTDESTFTLVVRVEAIDLNHSTSGSTFRDDLKQLTIGINFRPVERTVFKISFTFVDSDEAGFVGGSADRFVVSWASYF